MLMNRHDVQDALDHYAHRNPELINYGKAAYILAALVEWTDSTSDGWPYWNKPSNAARKLQEALQGWRRRYFDGDEILDLTGAELRAAVRPILAFLTRQASESAGLLATRTPNNSAAQLRAHIDAVTS